jgi:hypothetical protein
LWSQEFPQTKEPYVHHHQTICAPPPHLTHTDTRARARATGTFLLALVSSIEDFVEWFLFL